MYGKLFAMSLAAVVSSAHAFELAGFKGVKFGMDRQAVEATGYKCDDESDRVVCAGKDTLFGLPANARAWFRTEKVSNLRVVTIDSKPIDLVGLYTDALGKPKKYAYRRGANDVTVYYWLASNGTAVSTFTAGQTLIAKDPDTGKEKHYATADYLDRQATANLLEEAKKASQAKRDF